MEANKDPMSEPKPKYIDVSEIGFRIYAGLIAAYYKIREGYRYHDEWLDGKIAEVRGKIAQLEAEDRGESETG